MEHYCRNHVNYQCNPVISGPTGIVVSENPPTIAEPSNLTTTAQTSSVNVDKPP